MEIPAAGQESPEVVEPSAEELVKQKDSLKKEIQKLRREKARVALRVKHGDEVVELIPEGLSVEEMESLGEKLAAKIAPQGSQQDRQNESGDEHPAPDDSPDELSDTERELARVTQSPASGTHVPPDPYTNADLDKAVRSGDMAAFRKIAEESIKYPGRLQLSHGEQIE